MHNDLIDLFSFSMGSVSLHGGNITNIDIANVIGIKVMHETCGKSDIQSKGNSYSECFTSPGVSYASPPCSVCSCLRLDPSMPMSCIAVTHKFAQNLCRISIGLHCSRQFTNSPYTLEKRISHCYVHVFSLRMLILIWTSVL